MYKYIKTSRCSPRRWGNLTRHFKRHSLNYTGSVDEQTHKKPDLALYFTLTDCTEM